MKCYVYNSKNMNDAIGISLVVHCGSMNEKNTQRGFSHLLEHMLISFDKYNCNQEINCSGYTDFYYTCFSFLSTKRHMKECLEYINQIINGRFLTQDILGNIREDVLKEYDTFFRKENDIEYQWLLRRTKYIDQLAIGNLEIIKNCTIEQLREYFLKNYISENFELIIMGNISEKEINMFPYDNHLTIHNISQRYCTDRFEWINYGTGKFLKIYFIKVLEEPEDFIYEYLFCAIIENFLDDYYNDECAEVYKILLSRAEEFLCIKISKNNISNIRNLKIFINEMVEKIDKNYVSNFLKEYKEMYVNYLSNGYGINILNEMKVCINYLVFKSRFIGTQEINNLILNEIDNVDIDKILKMIIQMKINEKTFYLYKILEI